MATEVSIDPGSRAKIRHPVAVPVLTVITIGIYGIYWWYQVNREMADLGRARQASGLGDNPTMSLLAVFPGALVIVPPYFSLYNGVARMKRTQEVTVGSASLNGWIIIALILLNFVTGVAGLIVPGYIQSELNKAWHSLEGAPAAAPAAEPAAEQPQGEQPPVPQE